MSVLLQRFVRGGATLQRVIRFVWFISFILC
jgi:hypothetical protein